MIEVFLTRYESDKKGTFGNFQAELIDFISLELPWCNNLNRISCIPVGIYQCEWTYSNRLKRHTYEVLRVPNREGIRIHPANYPEELEGCIALGLMSGKMNGKKAVMRSRDAVREFEKIFDKKPFTLIIKEELIQ